MTLGRSCLLATLLFLGSRLGAETLYVTDKLRLGVYLTRDTTGEPFAYLRSGDRVEALERDGSLSLVELEDQRSGWVRGSFLQADEPALRRIAAIEAERDRLAAELESLRTDDGDAERQRLEVAAREAVEQAAAATDEVARLEAENRSQLDELAGLRGELAALGDAVPRVWLVAGVAGALVLGGLLAWRWLDYRSRRRHGGFRIY